jgi:hypothetical protein
MPYAYQGDNCYGRGDYYRGDYYRGDPGLFGFLGKIAKTVVRAVVPGGGALLDIAGGILKARRPPGTSLATIPQVGPPAFQPNVQTQVQTGGLFNLGYQQIGGGGGGGGGGAAQVPMVRGPDGQLCQLKGYHVNRGRYYTRAGVVEPGTKCVKNRRMNVLNPKALRRGLRRAFGFKKIAMRTLHLLSPTKPKRFAGFKRKRAAR